MVTVGGKFSFTEKLSWAEPDRPRVSAADAVDRVIAFR